MAFSGMGPQRLYLAPTLGGYLPTSGEPCTQIEQASSGSLNMGHFHEAVANVLATFDVECYLQNRANDCALHRWRAWYTQAGQERGADSSAFVELAQTTLQLSKEQCEVLLKLERDAQQQIESRTLNFLRPPTALIRLAAFQADYFEPEHDFSWCDKIAAYLPHVVSTVSWPEYQGTCIEPLCDELQLNLESGPHAGLGQTLFMFAEGVVTTVRTLNGFAAGVHIEHDQHPHLLEAAVLFIAFIRTLQLIDWNELHAGLTEKMTEIAKKLRDFYEEEVIQNQRVFLKSNEEVTAFASKYDISKQTAELLSQLVSISAEQLSVGPNAYTGRIFGVFIRLAQVALEDDRSSDPAFCTLLARLMMLRCICECRESIATSDHAFIRTRLGDSSVLTVIDSAVRLYSKKIKEDPDSRLVSPFGSSQVEPTEKASVTRSAPSEVKHNRRKVNTKRGKHVGTFSSFCC